MAVPFNKAAAVFEGAFLSTDPSKGGCPALPPPPPAPSSPSQIQTISPHKDRSNQFDLRQWGLLDHTSQMALITQSLSNLLSQLE